MENFNEKSLNLGNDIIAQATGPLTMNKVVDKAQGVVGDTLTYTITISNPSNSGISTSPIAFQDTIPQGTVYSPGTLLIDGTPNPGNVETGLTLTGLNPGESHQIIFKVLVTTFPGGVVKNYATIDYTWGNGGVFPNRGGNTGQAQTVPGPDVTGRVVLTKSTDKTVAAVGDQVTYTLVAINIGTVTVNNVTITDTIPQGTSYVSSSTTINNGTPQNTNPQNGINIGTLTSGQSTTIVFKVKVDTIPNPNPFYNQGILGFQYTSNGQTLTGAGVTGNVFTTVTGPSGSGSISIVKSTNKSTASVNEEIEYTVVLTNNGTLNYSKLHFVDTLPNNTSFVSGSVTVNGTVQPTFNPQTGFDITPALPVNGVATVTFRIKADTIPTPNPITNVANGIYTTSNGRTSNLSNSVNTTITSPAAGSLATTKSTDKTNAVLGEEITYTSVITNTGSLPLTNVIFTDTIQASNISFVANSVTVNGSANTGNPSNGISLGNIAIGGIVTVIFKVKVNGTPVPNPIPNINSVEYTYTPNGSPSVTKTSASNNVQTLVSIPTGTGTASMTKAVDKATATVSEEITYTSVITNTGSLPLTNVIFTDTLQATGISFVQNSVIIDGVLATGNPISGINLGTIPVGGTKTIIFKVKIDTTPNPNPIPNASSTSFNYISGGTTQTGNANSNTVNTSVTSTTIPTTGTASIVKSVDKTLANVSDEITYTSVITNTGSLPLTNIIFTDTLQSSGTTFISNSVTVNGSVNTGNPSLGINVGNLAVGSSLTIVFKVKLDTLPVPNPIPNGSTTTFNYTSGGTTQSGTANSNVVNTTVTLPTGTGTASIVKSVDKTSANIGDGITYTSVITNTGSLPLTNVIFTDTIQASNVSFVSNSVTVNGSTNTGNPSSGINIGNLAVGGVATVVFRVTINTIPVPNPIPNTSSTSFNYVSGGATQTGNANSNLVNTNVQGTTIPSTGSASVNKQVDKTTANVGDVITYTSVITNTGSLPLTNVIFTDTIQASNVSFVANSVTVNGSTNTGNPSSGINIGNLAVGGVATVVFRVTINTIPVPNPIPNTSKVDYTYTPSGGTPQAGTNTSNLVNTSVQGTTIPSGGSASLNKQVDKATASVGDELNYVVAVNNTGNLPLTNVIFTDTLQASNISFVAGSLTVNFVPNSGDSSIGVNIGNIPVGGTIVVSYRVKVNGTPTPNPIPNTAKVDYTYTPSGGTPQTGTNTSNLVNTQVSGGSSGSTSISKAVDKTSANVGDVITYTSVITNTGSLPLANVIFTDTIQASNVSFVANSVTVNGSTNTGNPSSGINIGNLAVGGVATVVFRVTINTIPVPNPIPNTSKVDYTYTPSGGTPQTGTNTSNLVNTSVQGTTIPSGGSASLNKQVDKATASVGDELNYVVAVNNTGNLPLTNVIFTDTLQASNISFVAGSLTVNFVPNSGDPSIGVNIGNIPVGGTIIVSYRVKVNGTPTPNPIPNTAKVDYTYTPSGGTPQTGTNTSNLVNTQVSGGSSGSTSINKTVDKASANVGDVITYTSVITNTGSLPLANVIFTDTIQASNVSFVSNSVTVNGSINTGNPSSGINIGNLAVGGVATVVFRVTINTIPVPNPIPNTSKVDYTYTPSGGTPQTGINTSNLVNTSVQGTTIPSGGSASLNKQVDKTTASIGDELNYVVAVNNTGNLPLTNVIFTDTLQASNISFVAGSLTVNFVPNLGDPSTGVNIGNIPVGGTIVVAYRIKVNGTPTPNPIPNTSKVDYTYTPSGGTPQTGTNTSNTVTTQVGGGGSGSASIIKSVDKTTANIGDEINYVSIIRNTGTSPLTNVTFTDALEATGLSFVFGSVTINGTPNLLSNPAFGISLSDIPVGGIVAVSFKAKINSLPVPNPIPNSSKVDYTYTPIGGTSQTGTNTSNIVNTQVAQTPINKPITTVLKEVDKTATTIGSKLTYTIRATNTGTVIAENVNVTDIIPQDTSFVQGSVTVNGVSKPSDNPNSGIAIGTLAIGQTVVVTYKVILPAGRLPVPNPILNTANLAYSYRETPTSTSIPVTLESNTVSTTVTPSSVEPIKNPTKVVDKAYAKVTDILTFTVRVKNTGTVDGTNVIFKDTLPSELSFVQNSVTVDGVLRPGANPEAGINLGTISPNGEVVITFKALVTKIPSINPITNIGSVSYEYKPSVTEPSKPVITPTNPTTTTVNKGSINNNDGGLIKAVDKSYAKIDDILTYTIRVKNTGNVDVNNVVLNDRTPNGTTFVLGSVTVNGASNVLLIPDLGIQIGTMKPGQVVVVTFKVKVTTLPNPNPIPNEATVTYTYTVDPTKPNSEKETNTSNKVTTAVNQAIIADNTGIIKSVDKEFAMIEDVITYNILLKNTGNVDALNVMFKDVIPNGTEFITNTFTIDGGIIAGANPNNSVNVGTIVPNGSKNLSFKVKIIQLPNPNPIPNKGNITYEYSVNPMTSEKGTGNAKSNTVYTRVNGAIINPSNGDLVKFVDKEYAKVGERITYTVKVRNSGNVDALNIIFKDTIPKGTEFVSNSVVINGSVVPLASPSAGIFIGTLKPGQTALISFSVLIKEIPNPNPIPNEGHIEYKYLVDPQTGKYKEEEAISNKVTTLVNTPNFKPELGGIVKEVDKTFAKIGDTITYTIRLSNKGNTSANNVVLMDTLKDGLKFINGSVTINGFTSLGANPETGIQIGTIKENTGVIVIFKCLVTKIPTPNPILNNASINYSYTVNPNNPNGEKGSETSNTVQTKVNSAEITGENGSLLKSVNKDFAAVGEEITYTIKATNTGNVDALNVVIYDTIPEGCEFVQESVVLNGKNILSGNPEIGIQLGTLRPLDVANISYKVKVIRIPKINPIPNTAKVNYSFILDPNSPNATNVENNSNTVFTKVNSPNINTANGSVYKTVNKEFAKVNEELIYTIFVENKGNVAANDVVILDTIPEGTEFVLNSVFINDINQPMANPSLGINVGSINPGKNVELIYKVRVKEIPKVNPIPNTASVKYSFTKNPNNPNGERDEVITNTVYTKINDAIIDTPSGGLVKAVDKLFVDIGEVITYTIKVQNKGNVVANNVLLKDTIPSGTEFISGSVRIDGILNNGNPGNGISLGTLDPGEINVVSFKVRATEVISPNIIRNASTTEYTFTKNPNYPNEEKEKNTSNVVETVINTANISFEDGGLVKRRDKEYAKIGEEIVYTIALKNTGNVMAENVVLVDTTPNGCEFVTGSVTIDGTSNGTLNPNNGINLGNLPVNGTAVIQFKVKVVKIPNPNPIPNKAKVNYRYLVQPTSGTYNSKENYSNTVFTKVNSAIIDPNNGDIVKEVDRPFADLNEIITYTIKIKNSGNTDALNVVVKDTIPEGTEFIQNSIYVNNGLRSNENIESGITINRIPSMEEAIVSFKVKVITLPNPNRVRNVANIEYSFVVNPIDQREEKNTASTNIVTTTINNGEINTLKGGLVKSVDKGYVKPGEELTYTIKVKNTGNTGVNNVILTDTPPVGTSFVNGSILVNGSSRLGDNIISGVSLGTLNPNEESVVLYRVLVLNTLVDFEIKNNAKVSYSYTVNPLKPDDVKKQEISNTVITKVNFASISFENNGAIKSVDKNFADLNDELLYTIVLKNKGNVDATNVILKDTIPEYTSLVPNSVFVDNNQILGTDPTRGINVGIIKPNGISVITFKVLVVSIPRDKIIKNNGRVSYNFTMNPNNPNGEYGKTQTNTVETEIKTGEITDGTIPKNPDGTNGNPAGGFTKYADKKYASLNDIITYTFNIKNTGNIEVNDVYVTDLIPEYMKFVSGSFSIDGFIDNKSNPKVGVNIGSIGSLKTKIISFKALVVSVPENNKIDNKADLSYSYIIDKNKPAIKKNATSNIATVIVNASDISLENGGLIKQVDKEYVSLGEELTYSIKVKNTGNVKANNVILKDTIPEGTEFIPGSVVVNGKAENTLNPQTGIGLLVVDPGEINVISFKVKVIKFNKDFKIYNNTSIYYEFVVDPNEVPIKKYGLSNTVVTKENSVLFQGEGFKKSISEKYGNVGDIVTYTFNIKNSGNINANTVVFKDTIANGLAFIDGSVFVNDINLDYANPIDGISLGTVASNVGLTLSFKVKVIDIPKTNPLINVGKLIFASQVNPLENPIQSFVYSNKEELYIKDPGLKVIKSSDKKEYVVSDIVTFTIALENKGNTEVLEAKVFDSLAEGLKFINGTVVVRGESRLNDNITSGVLVKNIKQGEKVFVSFKAEIVSLPEDKTIKNKAKVLYSYSLNPNDDPIGEETYSNEVVINIEDASLQISKDGDITLAKLDDIITYKVKVKNTGTVDALNVIFIDSLPNEVEFIEGSFEVNNKMINSVVIKNGVSLGDLKVGEELLIQYKVKVISLCCKRLITNIAYTRFEYKIKDNSPIRMKESKMVTNVIRGQSPNFRQMNIDGVIKLDSNMPAIEEINEVTAEVTITNKYVIDTIKGHSNENTKLTGHKLVINGYITERVEYTALNTSQSNHYTCNIKKFSTFIILQENYKKESSIKITPLIEDVLFDKIADKTIYTNVTFNLDLSVMC